MKFGMAKNSIFAILLRSPWWFSFLIAAITFAAARAFIPAVYALFSTLPFLVIGCYTAWKQSRAPSPARVAGTLESLRALSWDDFSGELEEVFLRSGYEVKRLSGKSGGGADLELTKSGRVSLVGCKRWKVARTGVEPLRELRAAMLAREAQGCIYVAAGEITDTARAYAEKEMIRLVHDAELAQMFPLIAPTAPRAAT